MSTKKESKSDNSNTAQEENGWFDAIKRTPMKRILTWGTIFVLTIVALGKGKDDQSA